MKKKYSKSSECFSIDTLYQKELNNKVLKQQKNTIANYINFIRKTCILCKSSVENVEEFTHKEDVEYIVCSYCGHIQSKNHIDEFNEFTQIYSSSSIQDYEKRVNGIYTPKRDWIIEALLSHGINEKTLLKQKKWFEFGSGLGYFLKSLEPFVEHLGGLEKNVELIENSKTYLNKSIYLTNDYKYFEDLILNGKIDILSSFFVLEHLNESLSSFVELISKMKRGSFFVFSVPIFGFSTVIENVFADIYSNNLDSIVHTNIFTEESIDYMLKKSGFRSINKWYFAQDSIDLFRGIMNSIEGKYSNTLNKDIENKLIDMIDSFQNSIDKAHFSSNLHVIAIKE